MFSKYLLPIICLIGFNFETEAKVYRWKDKNGNWVYSDTPRKGSERVKLHTPMQLTTPNTDQLNKNNIVQQSFYKANITSPSPSQNIHENTGTIYVTGQIQPSFNRGLKVQLLLDGKATGPMQNSTTFVLKDVPKGKHALQLFLFNPGGKIIAQSNNVTFFLHRAGGNKR